MIHRVGNVEIEVGRRPTDFMQGVVYDHCGRSHVKEVKMYKATVIGQSSRWGRGRSPTEAIEDLILTHSQVFWS